MGTFNNKTLLVVGGAGFIGSNFTRHILASYKGVRVVVFDKLTYSGNLENLKDVANDVRYSFVRGDVADSSALHDAFLNHHPDYVINFAAETHVDRSIHVGALEFVKTNVEGIYNLLEEVKGSGKVACYVQVSTDEVFGSLPLEGGEPFRETTAFAPNVPYAATKAGGDLLCRAYFSTWKVPVIVTHCSNNYGPFQYPEKLIPFFITRVMEKKKVPLYGDGKHVRDWIYVLDHCRALELCLLKGAPGEVYNIGADNEMNNIDIATRILKRFGHTPSSIEFVTDRPGHDRRYAIDSSKIRAELGFVPEHSFDQAFDLTIDWYIHNSDWIRRVRERTGVFNPHIDLWKGHTLP